MKEKIIEVMEGLMHVRGTFLEGIDGLTATKEIVTATGLPSECNEALNSMARRATVLVNEMTDHILKMGLGAMTDDIRPILNFGNPEKNV